MGAVAGADERRQPAQLQEFAHHPHPRTALQGDGEVRRQHQPMQPLHALRARDERRQARGRRTDRRRLAPVLQGTARQAQIGGHLPLRLSRRQTGGGHLTLLRPLQARAAPHDQPAPGIRAAHSGTGPVARLKSIPAGPSNIFLRPRLVCTAKGTKFRGFCHSPAALSPSPALGLGRIDDQGPLIEVEVWFWHAFGIILKLQSVCDGVRSGPPGTPDQNCLHQERTRRSTPCFAGFFVSTS